ncbi:MAG TPA: LamG-like jellyroll fold domain-containing protein [Bacteroidales bacterium]|nr:LamG-like jellyroll fold domain-containing protein [Bacteroidales bacterium]
MKKKNFFQVLFLGTALVTGFCLTSCNKDDNNNNNAVDPSTIATTNLVAYFPFNDNAIESIANLTPTAQPLVTYVTGRRGKAYQGADGAHLLYTLPTNSKLKTLTSFSVAMWFKSPLVTGDPEPIFFQIGKSDDLYWGNLTLALNRLTATADSLAPKAFFLKNGATWSGQHIGYTNTIFKINQWMHLIFEYDGTTSKYVIYKDGIKVTTNTGVEDRKANEAGVPLGNLSFLNADVINIGAWRPKTEGTATDGWMGWFKGNLDELRVYDKALNATEAKALYDAEVSQML